VRRKGRCGGGRERSFVMRSVAVRCRGGCGEDRGCQGKRVAVRLEFVYRSDTVADWTRYRWK